MTTNTPHQTPVRWGLLPPLLLTQPGFSDIREIVPMSSYWPWALGALLLVLLAAFFVARWWRGKRTAHAEAAPTEPPDLKALRLLDLLRENAGQLEAEIFAIEVSTILRNYLEEALDLPAPEQTSEEFLQGLRGQSWLTPDLQQDLENFMQLSDLVKFARQSLDASQRQHLLASAARVVETTRPRTEPPPEPKSQPETIAR